MSLRIAMIGACAYPVPQGSQVYLRDSALALHERGHEVHLVVYGHGTGTEDSGLRIHRCRRLPGDRRTASGPALLKPILDLALLHALRRVIHRHEIQVVCAHNYEALLIALAARKRPILYFAHNAMADELPHYFRVKVLVGKAGHWLDRHFPRRADHVIAPHQRLADYLVDLGCDARRVSVLAPPVDAEQFEGAVRGGDIPLNPHSEGGLKRGAAMPLPPVLYAGNLDAYQNLDLLLEAMTHLRRTLPEARLIIATHQHADLPGAELIPAPGFQALGKILAQDAVFAVPRVSWSGYPIKLLNGMAAGLPVVACQSAAHPLVHGENGLIVPDNDAAAFADALRTLLLDPTLRQQLGQQARDTIAMEHAPTNFAHEVEQVARRLLL